MGGVHSLTNFLKVLKTNTFIYDMERMKKKVLLKLLQIDELWREVKPGVSSYADDPKKAAESINQLLVRKSVLYKAFKVQLWFDGP